MASSYYLVASTVCTYGTAYIPTVRYCVTLAGVTVAGVTLAAMVLANGPHATLAFVSDVDLGWDGA